MALEVVIARGMRAAAVGPARVMPTTPAEYHVEIDAAALYTDAALTVSVTIERSDDGVTWRHAASFTRQGRPRGLTAEGQPEGNPTLWVDNPGGARFRVRTTFNKATSCRVLDETVAIPYERKARPPQSIGLVQSITTGGTSAADTFSLSYGSSTAASGSALAAAVSGWRSGGSGGFQLADITDNKSNDWQKAGQGGISTDVNAMGFYMANAAGGASHQVDFDPTGTGNSIDVALFELSDAATSGLLGGTAGATANGTTSISTGNLSAAGASGDIEIAACTATTTGTKTVGALTPAYTEIAEGTDGANDRVFEHDYRILTGTTSDGASWSQATGSRWSGFAFVLKATGGVADPEGRLVGGKLVGGGLLISGVLA